MYFLLVSKGFSSFLDVARLLGYDHQFPRGSLQVLLHSQFCCFQVLLASITSNERWSQLQSKQRSKFKWSTSNIVCAPSPMRRSIKLLYLRSNENEVLQMAKNTMKTKKLPKMFSAPVKLVFAWPVLNIKLGKIKKVLAAAETPLCCSNKLLPTSGSTSSI